MRHNYPGRDTYLSGVSLHRASTGATVKLAQVLGRGGEGTVHAIGETPKLVAKIYLKPPDADKVEKLKLMTRGKSKGLLGVAAWPMDLLSDEQGAVRGFLMGRIAARQDAHRLYSPKSRRRTFPDADFQVRGPGRHQRGARIRADTRGRTRDRRRESWQRAHRPGWHRGTHRLRFDTGDRSGPHVPVRRGLAVVHAAGIARQAISRLAPDHESRSFGLAALLFHLLFQGRHPSRAYTPMARCRSNVRSPNRVSRTARRPPRSAWRAARTLALTTFGRPIARLFERAFAPPGGEEERPSAIEWIEALQALENELAACPLRPRHFHPRGASCCWCEIETLTGARLFDDRQGPSADADAVTAEQLWKAIEGVHPPAALELPRFAWTDGGVPAGKFQWSSFRNRYLPGIPVLLVGGIVGAGILGSAFGEFNSIAAITVMVIAGISLGATAGPDGQSRLPRALHVEWERALAQWRKTGSAGLFASARKELEKSRRSLREIVDQK